MPRIGQLNASAKLAAVEAAPYLTRAQDLVQELAGSRNWRRVITKYDGPVKIKIPHVDFSQLTAAAARSRIMAQWKKLGGAGSELGLPADVNFSIVRIGNRYICQFRGGTMSVDADSGEAMVAADQQVRVIFEGFGLEVRQEKGDEIYGKISCEVGSTGYKRDFVIPEVTLGPEGNNRIAQLGIVLYEGPPVNLNIAVGLAEHDSGDRAAIRAEFQSRFVQIFNEAEKMLSAGASSASSMASVAQAAEAVASSDLLKWVVREAGGLISDLMGMGDDPYNPCALVISHGEMRTPPPMLAYRCSSDPRLLPFNFKRTTTGRDDGGDVGQISALFSVRPL